MASQYSRVSAAFTVFACCISGGLLTLPAVFEKATFGPALILVALAGVTTGGSLLALVVLRELNPKITGLGALMGWAGGHVAELAGQGVIGVFLNGILGGSMIIVHDYLHKGISMHRAPSDLHANLLTVAAAAAVGVMALPRSMGALAFAAQLSVAAFCFLVFTLVYYGASDPIDVTRLTWWGNSGDDPQPKWVEHVVSVMPVILYAFGCQFQVFDIYAGVEAGREAAEGRRRAPEERLAHFGPVVGAAVAMMAATFSLVGVFGACAFPGQSIDGDVLVMLAGKGVLGNVARGVLVLAVLLAAPLIVHPARSCVDAVLVHLFCGGNAAHSPLRHRCITFTIVGLGTCLAVSEIKFMTIIGAMGAFVASPLLFILPGVALIWMLQAKAHRALPDPLGLGPTLESSLLEGGAAACQLPRGLRWAMLGMGVWLVLVGAATFVLSLVILFR